MVYIKQLRGYLAAVALLLTLSAPTFAALISAPITVTENGQGATLTISVTWAWVAEPDDGGIAGCVACVSNTAISDDYNHLFCPQFPVSPSDQMKTASWPQCIPAFAPQIFAQHYHLHVGMQMTTDPGQTAGTYYVWDMWFWIYNDGQQHEITMDPMQGQLGTEDATSPPCIPTETPPSPTCGSSTSGTTGGTTGGSTGSTGGSTGGASNDPNFWTSLFEPDDAHVQALKQAQQSLLTAGPWGQVGSVAGQVGSPARNNEPLFPATIQLAPAFSSGRPDQTVGDSNGNVNVTLPMPGHDFPTGVGVGIDAPGNPLEPIGTPWGESSDLNGWRNDLLKLVEWTLVVMAAVAFCLWMKGRINV